MITCNRANLIQLHFTNKVANDTNLFISDLASVRRGLEILEEFGKIVGFTVQASVQHNASKTGNRTILLADFNYKSSDLT